MTYFITQNINTISLLETKCKFYVRSLCPSVQSEILYGDVAGKTHEFAP